MLRRQLRHPLPCSPERFWDLFLDPGFTRTMIVDGLGFHACDLGDLREDGQVVHRSMTVTPRLELPRAVTKVIGDSLSYREEGRFDRSTQTWSWETKIAVMSDRIRLGGDMTVEPGPKEHTCVRVADLWVDVRIFGVARVIEKAADKSLEKGWGESADWMRGYLRDHPAPDSSGT